MKEFLRSILDFFGRRYQTEVECSEHGKGYAAFVCCHLVKGENLGFWEPIDTYPNKEYFNDKLQGWCNQCDEVLMKYGKWNEESEAYAKIRVVCDRCFFEIKAKNQIVNP